jgi:hypothetical protein
LDETKNQKLSEREVGEIVTQIADLRHSLRNQKQVTHLLNEKVLEQQLALATLKTRLNTTIAVGFALVNLVGLALNWMRTVA